MGRRKHNSCSGSHIADTEKFIKFTTPNVILERVIASEESITVADLDVIIASYVHCVREKLAKCHTIIYVPDTRIARCSSVANNTELSIFRDVLDKIRIRLADYIKEKIGCNVMVTYQPVDNIAEDCHSSIKWLSVKKGDCSGKCVKFKSFINSELLAEEIPSAFEDHPNILFEDRQRVGTNGIMVRRHIKPNITTADTEMHLPLELKIKLLIDALSGAIYLRDLGFVHCDIKPHNIFIEKDANSGELEGKVGDLEGILRVNKDNTKRLPTFTAEFCEDVYYSQTDESDNTIYPIDESRDSFSWAITIAYFLSTKLQEVRIVKDLRAFRLDVDVWMQNLCRYFGHSADLKNLIELCKHGVLQDRAARPTLEEYKECLVHILQSKN